MKKKNIILLIIAIVMFILVGSTMAYFGWSSSAENKDQLVDVTVAGGTGSCDKLSDNNKLLYPTSTREKGRILKVTTKQQMATNAFVTWNLVVNSINETTLTTSGLKHKSFKYELVNDTTGVSYGTGSFENVTNGTTITLSTDKETLDYNKEYTFILYLWIDGTIGNNPLDMTNQPYNFDLNCNITGTSTKIVPTDAYELTNGDGTTYTPTYTGSGTKAVRSTAPLSKFREVRVDDTVVDSSNYTITEGSTIVTFKESYLEKLSPGYHTLKIISEDGFASGKITIETAATYITDLYNNAPKTTVISNDITYNTAPSVRLMNDRLGGTTSDLNGGNIRFYGITSNSEQKAYAWNSYNTAMIFYQISQNLFISNQAISSKENCITTLSQATNCTSSYASLGFSSVAECETGLPNIISQITNGETTSVDGVKQYLCSREVSSTEPGNVNNYIYFNCNNYSNPSSSTCEIWRIIGVFDGKLKIIRNSTIGELAWDSNGIAAWSTSTLQKILNENYYNGNELNFKIKNETTRNMITSVKWNIGTYYSSRNIFSNAAYSSEITKTWSGKIALPTVSDYLYSNDFLSSAPEDIYIDMPCQKNNNWLSQKVDNFWFLNIGSYSDSETYPWNLSGYIYYANNANNTFGILPTLYLKPELKINSGDGSESNPYTLKVS